MKAILTKSEKEKLLEQFEKSGKTHAQFAYIRKHLWKTEKEFNTDIIRAMKERIR